MCTPVVVGNWQVLGFEPSVIVPLERQLTTNRWQTVPTAGSQPPTASDDCSEFCSAPTATNRCQQNAACYLVLLKLCLRVAVNGRC